MQATDPALLLRFDMKVDSFTSDWAYCDRLSSYLARMVSHNRTDSVLYSNLLSSVLNELLETAFRRHATGGDFSCAIYREGTRDRIELSIPCDEDARAFYADAIEGTKRPDIGERYRDALFSAGPLVGDIGLMELAVDYAARLSIGGDDSGPLRLIAELALEEGPNNVE